MKATQSERHRWSWFFTPVLARLLQPRWQAWVVLAAAGLISGGSFLGWPVWVCPFHALTGVPCPGCGLSRAVTLLLQGKGEESLQVHAFAPVFLAGLVLIGGVSLLPERAYRQAVGWIGRFERRTGCSTILLILLIMYWVIRLITQGFHFI